MTVENLFFKKRVFSSNLVLISLFVLIITFWIAQYNLFFSFTTAVLWITFLMTKWPNYKVGLLTCIFFTSLVSFYSQQFWFAFPVPRVINNCEFTVSSVKNNYVILKSNHWKILYWNKDQPLVLNQKIRIISATIKSIEKTKNSFSFDFSNFLKTQYVFNQFEKIEFTIDNESWNLRFRFFSWINNSQLHFLVKDLLWRETNLLNLKSRLDNLDWGYLWILNGFGFSLITKFGNKVFVNYLDFKSSKIIGILNILVWFSYWYLLAFNLIILRFLIVSILKTFKMRIGSYQNRVLILLLISWWEPLFLLRQSSWFLLAPYLIWPSNKDYSWHKRFFLSLIIIVPLQVMLNYRINFSGPLLTLLLAPIFALIHCLLFLFWWCPFLYHLWEFCLIIINWSILLGEQLVWFWNVGQVPLIFYFLYFITLSHLIRHKSRKFFLVSCVLLAGLIFTWNKIILGTENIFMLNVGNGNSFVYINKFKNIVLIFDCGSGPGYSPQIMADFLKWKGINHVDYVFISHFHQDHFNGLESLKRAVKIKEIITNNTAILNWNFKGISIMGWKLSNMEDVNDGSLVLLLKTSQNNLLFMGDLTKVGEKKLIETTDFAQIIKQNRIDWMQIGHHGSKNATSFELLYLVNPRYAFISSGLKNRHQFPDQETINQLQRLGIKIFSTSDNFSWRFNLISRQAIAFH